jgi:hypothetical protein
MAICAAVAMSWLLLASPGIAGTIYTLDQAGCSGGCGTGPFGQVTLSQVDTHTVNVSVLLFNGDGFVKTGAGKALEFNITGTPAITISDLTSGFSEGPSPAKAGSFGKFNYSVSCTGCGNGGSNPLPGPLDFDVVVASGLSVNDFIANKDGYFFVSDITGTHGSPRNVAANSGQPSSAPSVPEPGSYALLGSGLCLVGLFRKYFTRG